MIRWTFEVWTGLDMLRHFLFFSFFCSAPEISLKPEENRREELYYSDQYNSDRDAEEPLLSHKTNTPSYSI